MSEPNQPFDALTTREAEILALLAEGLSDREIADRLTVAYTTVKWYNRQIFNKLGVEKRREAIQQAKALGLLDTPPQLEVRKSNLPAYTTPFVGRQHELEDLAGLLQDKAVRLVTILAAGGMGKTRFALEAAEQQVSNFQNGVYFIPLQPLTEVEQIVPAVAQHIGFQFAQDSRPPKQQLFDYLNGKKMLLVVDNWEHLLDGAPLISEILQAAPDVKVLATSREKLNLSDETVYLLRGMQFPMWETPEDALQYDAVKLLVQAAKRLRPDFEVIPENLDIVARVCRLTEGMPLGILLAISWLDTLSLERIAEEIQKSVDFLETEMRDVPERQRSIRAVFESAWERLTSAEQQVFMKLSVFRGGCTPEAAEALTGAKLRTLQTLFNKALLLRTKTGRYDIHELLRQYGYERLQASGALAEVLHQHSVYFAGFLRQREDDLKGRRQIEAIEEIEAELDNVHQSGYQALLDEDIELIEMSLFSLMTYANFRSRQAEFVSMFAGAEAVLRPKYATHRTYGRLLAYYGRLMYWLTRLQEAEFLLRQSLAIAQASDDPSGMAYSSVELARSIFELGKRDEAGQLVEDSIHMSAAQADDYQLEVALYQKGHQLAISGKNDEALAITRQALEMQRRLGDNNGIANSLSLIAVGFRNAGQYDEAEAQRHQILALQRRLKQPFGVAFSLRELAFCEFVKGSIEASRRYAEEALQIAREIAYPDEIAWSLLSLMSIEIASDQFDEAELKGEEALSLGFYSFHPQYLLSISFVRLGQRDWVSARTALIEYMKQPAVDLAPGAHQFSESVLCMGFIMAEEGQTERGLELASLGLNHRYIAKGFANSRLVSRHLEAIKSKLTEEAFAAAWERGKELTLEAVVAELLTE